MILFFALGSAQWDNFSGFVLLVSRYILSLSLFVLFFIGLLGAKNQLPVMINMSSDRPVFNLGFSTRIF
jgi:hypothetical protein